MGARKLFYLLKPVAIGINAFEQLIAAAGLCVPQHRSKIRTTVRSTDGEPLSNLTHGIRLSRINQLWVSDLSYLIDGAEVYYLVHLLDVYSRRLLAVAISQTMKAEQNLLLLRQSFAERQQWSYPGLIHHSDAGAQYTSRAYCRELQRADIAMSVAETCLQNAYSERLNGILKNEYLSVSHGLRLDDWKTRLQHVQWLYNYQRPHQELGYRTPIAFEAYCAALPPEQRPILQLHDFQQLDAPCADSPINPPSLRETGDTSCQPIL